MYNLNFSRARSKKGVSDILGNILILAITVTLFSTLFYWVSTIPPPPSSVKTDFTAYVLPNTGAPITYINITNIGGSPLYESGTIIYISYENDPAADNHYTIEQGGIADGSWTPGKSWSISGIDVSNPGAITISIIDTSKNVLVWSNQLQVQATNIPPQFTAVGTTPDSPIIMGDSFVLWAKVVDPTTSVASVTVSIPYITGSSALAWDTNSQQWDSTFAAPILSQNTTVTALITATGSNGLTTEIALSISFVLPKSPPTLEIYPSPIYSLYNGIYYISAVFIENTGGRSALNTQVTVYYNGWGVATYYNHHSNFFGCKDDGPYTAYYSWWYPVYSSGSTMIPSLGHNQYTFNFPVYGPPAYGNGYCTGGNGPYTQYNYIYVFVTWQDINGNTYSTSQNFYIGSNGGTTAT